MEYVGNPPGFMILPARAITPLAFRNRFTLTEKVTIEMAGIDVPTASAAARQQAAALRISQADILVASYIDLDRADTRAGVVMLESLGVLAAGRALVILDTPVQDVERPRG